jgi:lipopolysaccharide assembly outer membrane protein LptD (OstA)
MRAVPLLLALLTLLPAMAPGQEPVPSPTPTPSETPTPSPSATPTPTPGSPLIGAQPLPGDATAAPSPAAPASPAAEQLPPGEILIRAETQSAEKGHYEFRGFVDLRSNEFRIQADALDYFEDTPEGATAPVRRIEAQGNVVFIRGEERLSGTRLVLDLDKSTGTFENALGYVTPGVFIEGKSIERIDSDTYRIEDGTFTSCAQPVPRWSFRASSAKLDIDDKITATNVRFKVKQVPAFYLPYFVYPIEKDQRSTGFLFPHFGYSATRGFNVGSGFFWAMGRHADQTFSLDRYSKIGWGFGHELRWMREAPSRGSFTTYLFRPKELAEWDYDINWMAMQDLPWEVKATVNARKYSNSLFQRQIQDSLDLASRRTSTLSSLNLQKTFQGTTVQLLADNMETTFGETETVNRHLPTLRVNRSPKKIGRTGLVFTFEGRAEGLALGSRASEEAEAVLESYGRYDVWPRLSRPLSVSFLQLTPEVQYRYTRWGASLDESGLFQDGVPIDRDYLETSVELRGPNFSRVFDTEGNFYSDKYKHVLGPEVVWLRRSTVDEFDAIKVFDGTDYIVGTNELQYALAQRFYAKRETRPGRSEAYEFLTWRVGQTYYFNVAEGQAAYDPNYNSSNYSPGLVPSHISPLQSRLRFRPTRQVMGNFDVEYDVNYTTLRSFSLSSTLEFDRLGLNASWSRRYRVQDDGAGTVTTETGNDTVRGALRLEVLPNRFSVQGTADYDIFNKNLIHTSGRLRYSVQCCGFMAEVIRTNYGEPDTRFGFSVELANIGSMGNFNGEEAAAGRRRDQGGLR